jgi:hypothetical protein
VVLPAADDVEKPALTDHAAWVSWLKSGGSDASWGASENEKAGRLLRELSSPDYERREGATRALKRCGIGVFPLLVADYRASRDLEKRLRIRKIAYERFMDEACPWFNAGFIGIRMEPRADGMMVMQVLPGTAAVEAGLQQFDVIVQVGERRVDIDQTQLSTQEGFQKAVEDFSTMVSSFRAGDKVDLTLMRSGQFRRIVLTLGRRTQRYVQPQNQTDQRNAEAAFEAAWEALVGEAADDASGEANDPDA